MTALPVASRTKLAKLLGMLGSDHAGERDAAARRLVVLACRTWRKTVAACLSQRGSLRAWEIGFLTDLPKFPRLSVKQRYVLKEIADRVFMARNET